MKIKSLLTWLYVAGSSIGLSASAEKGLISARPSERSGTLPLEAQFVVSAALGKEQAAYHFIPRFAGVLHTREPLNHAETSYQAANPNQHFNVRFDAQGASVTSDGTQWNLRVQAWGYGDQDYGIENIPTLREVGTTAPCVSANRVEYRRGALTEWYVNGPLGLQQGFTVQTPPARNATHPPATLSRSDCGLGSVAGGPARNNGLSRAPLTLVLNLPGGGGHSQVDADRTGLTLLTSKSEPSLRYSGLTALDTDGVRLPAWLETRENKLLLYVDDTKARYPIAIDPFVQQAKLIAADGAASNEFGNSVALSSDGNTAIAGAWQADVSTNANQGAAYIFTRTGSSWNLQAKLITSDGAVDDYFGYSVALSSDGDTAIVGAYAADVSTNADQGAAYVFTRSGSSWVQTSKLTAADGAASDYFGYSVTLNGYGHIAIVGAPGANMSWNVDQGAAYVFTRSGSSWVQTSKLTAADGAGDDYFGISVALSSDGFTAIAGAYRADVEWHINQGAAYVFARYGNSWSQQVKLTAADGAADDHFGISVALNSNGDTAIVGARGADVGWTFDQGAAYVFTRAGIGPFWSQQAKLTAADGATWDYFGVSVALSSDGNTAFAGAYVANVSGDTNQGAAYIFTRSGTNWSQQAKLTAADGAASDYFGRSMALSSDGDTAVAGAYGADVGGNADQGAAYVFTRSGAAWSQQAKLIAADGAASDAFGYSVALSGDGDTAIIGAYLADVGGNNNQGAAYVFTRSGISWTQQAKLTAADGAASDLFGVSVALSSDGNTATAGAYGANADQGAAYVFTRSGAAWTQQAKLTAADGAASDLFGVSVALSSDGNTAIAGAYFADVGGNVSQGAAYVFTRSGVSWSQQDKLIPSDGAASDRFGFCVALSSDGDTAIAGAYFADVGGNVNQGAAYVFTRSGAAWTQQAKLIAADGAVNDLFGVSVALSSDGDTAIAGAAWADVGGNADQGAAYVFTRSGSSGVQQVKLTAADGAANDYFGNSVALSGDGNTICAGAYLADVRGNINWGAAYVFTGSGTNWSQQANLTAADGALSDYFGYAVALSSDGNTAIVGAPGADVDENVNQGAAYVFALPPFGPDVLLNGVAGPLTVTAGSALVVTVSMNPAQYAGYPVDWWVAASTPFGLYYLNASLTWTPASSFSAFQPVYQGGLFDLQSAVVLNTTALPTGTYTFYFGVDTLNGILDPFGVYDSATVTVAP